MLNLLSLRGGSCELNIALSVVEVNWGVLDDEWRAQVDVLVSGVSGNNAHHALAICSLHVVVSVEGIGSTVNGETDCWQGANI